MYVFILAHGLNKENLNLNLNQLKTSVAGEVIENGQMMTFMTKWTDHKAASVGYYAPCYQLWPEIFLEPTSMGITFTCTDYW